MIILSILFDQKKYKFKTKNIIKSCVKNYNKMQQKPAESSDPLIEKS